MKKSADNSNKMEDAEVTPNDNTQPSSRSSRDEFFDASQYAFFGRNVSQEVELGGLEEEDGGDQFEDGEDILDSLVDRDEVSFESHFASDLYDLQVFFLSSCH